MANWYYKINRSKRGPVDDKELKRLADKGAITPIDQVMKDGTDTWVPASKIKGLFSSETVAAFEAENAKKVMADREAAKPKTARNIGAGIIFVVLMVVAYFLARDQPKPAIPLGQTVVIPQEESFQREYTASELARLYDRHQKSKEKILGKVVTVTGVRTASEASRQMKDNAALIILDGSKDGVTSNNLYFFFTPEPGGRFSLNFLQWLANAPDGTPITIQGEIATAPDNQWKVDFFLKKCKFQN